MTDPRLHAEVFVNLSRWSTALLALQRQPNLDGSLSVIGGGCALILFAIAELLTRRFFGSAAGDQFGALFGTFSIGIGGYVVLLLQAVVIAVVTAISSRHAVNKTLDSIQ